METPPVPDSRVPVADAFLQKIPAEFPWPGFEDDGAHEGLAAAARQSLAYYRSQPPGRLFSFGDDAYPSSHLADSLETFLRLLDEPENLGRSLRESFWVYAPSASAVVFSAYYEHSLEASLRPTEVYRYPLYRRPPDLVEDRPASGGAERSVGRLKDGAVIPYYTREEIDSGGALEGKGLEIAWARDPLEIFFLQVQGSGWLHVADTGERVRVRYAAHNGHPYRSVGGHLIERGLIPREKFSREAMAAFMNRHPDRRQSYLNVNPRYVFFELDRSSRSHEVRGSLQVPLTARRSVAADPAVFPPGALAWMRVEGDPAVVRFVLIQDEGGAIKGPGRIDYFAGDGPEAEAFAVRFWRKGRFFILVKKKTGEK